MIGELAALGAAICWTVSAVLYRKALLNTKPLHANLARCVSTSLLLVLFIIAIGKFGVLTNLPISASILTCASGIIGLGFGDTLYMLSLEFIGVARAVPITCTYPLFNLLLAAFLQGKTITPSVSIGAVTVVFGIWLLTGQEKNRTMLQRNILVKGVAFATTTAVLWAVSIVMINEAVTLPQTNSLEGAFAVNMVRILAAAVFLVISVPVLEKRLNFLKMPTKTFGIIVSAGIVALALGWFFLAFSFLLIPEARAVPISSTSPLFAAVSGAAVLKERVTVRVVAGSAVIVGGIFLLFLF
jgi:DME family drug/metabolite transporter